MRDSVPSPKTSCMGKITVSATDAINPRMNAQLGARTAHGWPSVMVTRVLPATVETRAE